MCRQRAGCNAGTLTAKSLVEAAARDVQAEGRLQPWSSKGWRLGLVEAAAKELEDACQEKVYAMWFDLGKLRRKSSTPAVVPGAAPALAKAGSADIYIYIYPRGLGFSDGGVGWGGVGWGYQRPDDHVPDTTLSAYMLAWGCSMSLRWHFVGVGWGGDINVLTTTSLILRCQHICSLEDATCHYVDTSLGWGGVGWGYQRPDDHLPDTTLSAYMLAWGCNMSLRWHFVGVGWGGDINVLTTTSLILRCQHICSLEDATCHYVDTSLGWGGVGWGYQRPDDHLPDTTLSAYMLAWGCNMSLRWHFVGVGWGGVGISTSWRPRPWYYVVSIYARLRMQHVTTLTLRWGGVGWGGDINVLTTTSLILRCQHICSLEDATCHYDTLAPWVFITKLYICIYIIYTYPHI